MSGDEVGHITVKGSWRRPRSISSCSMLSSLHWGLGDLAWHLRRERLYVRAEQENLQTLNEKITLLSTELAQYAWVSSHQRVNLKQLVLAKVECLPALICQRNYTPHNVVFIDASQVLGYQDAMAYGEFLSLLRESPELIASCLSVGDKTAAELMPGILHSISAGLFGSCLLPEDKILMLKLLRQLAVLQLVPSENPRRLLNHGSCAFARLYSVFHESMYSAKLFLTAALHTPIMKLLMEDETFLDIDPGKAMERFSPEERVRKFGRDNTAEHAAKVHKYREWMVKKLVNLAEHFITSLREHMYCFPASVCWLVRQLAGLFSKAGYLGEKEMFEICIDLVFTYFICPAIVNPEPYGITDAPIGYVSRLNLMQVAQILQMLAMRKYQGVDPKVADLYDQFRPDCVSSLIERILEDSSNCLGEQPWIEENNDIEGLHRCAAFYTHTQLNSLIRFLENLLKVDDESLEKRLLETLLTRLPPVLTNGHKTPAAARTSEKLSVTPELWLLKKPGLLSKAVGKQRSHSTNSTGNSSGSGANDSGDDSAEETMLPEQVLVIPLPGVDGEPVGMMSEQKVLDQQCKVVMQRGVVATDLTDAVSGERHRSESHEKRTRFSLSHDEGSIGNTSDNLEVVSEAASNHSGASSLESEPEDQNDNLSDMVSANVSGRGTPNISGRDTPSSQTTEGEEGRVEGEELRGEVREDRPVVVAVTKQTRSDIEDKFGKFVIKKQELIGDETISLVSDTWSTDVLASDGETVDQAERGLQRPLDDGPPHPFIQHSLDISETASEAWSTDVLASDSERLTEVDTDDTASVARSDDTAHSEFGTRGETPPPTAGFRPIRESRVSLVVPPSPTRTGDASNVTGRGGARADYRRRTLEFVDAGLSRGFNKTSSATLESSRMIHVIDKMDSCKPLVPAVATPSASSVKGRRARSPHPLPLPLPLPNGVVSSSLSTISSNVVPRHDAQRCEAGPSTEKGGDLFDGPPSPLLASPAPPSSLLPTHSNFLNNNSKPQPSSSFVLTNKYSEVKFKQEVEDIERVFLSSTSLASTSSSGSNSGPQPQSAVRNSDKGSVATGAIPKSISFDKTAERGDKELMDDDHKQKKGFFRNLKMSFKVKKVKHKGDDLGRFEENLPAEHYGSSRFARVSEEGGPSNGESMEDILAKYRGKGAVEGDAAENMACAADDLTKKLLDNEEDVGLSDESIFINAKRKLRLVFCNSDLQSWSTHTVVDNELLSFLKLQLAEAINVQNRALVSQLHETIRCVGLFDNEGCRRLFKSLKEDYQSRVPYIAYLVRSRQTLLTSLAHLERMRERLSTDSRVCSRFLVSLCVRMFLEKREDLCLGFTSEFQQLAMSDEKTVLLERFLKELSGQLERDPTWQGASEEQLEHAQSVIETAIMSRVYPYALFPNGDGDIFRDQVLHDHMKKLSAVITPNHKDLRIPKRFHVECPWPSAQAEISSLAAYKTPSDKVACVFRCAVTIMNLLSMGTLGEGNTPAADDFVPVLVYVLIAANPPLLLSTVQFVESFSSSRLEGEHQYWWTQFCSAIEFIKTMDYGI